MIPKLFWIFQVSSERTADAFHVDELRITTPATVLGIVKLKISLV